ncbi:MAG: hypothetical protein AAFO75_04620, partial [Pseudomonadota bacterium]
MMGWGNQRAVSPADETDWQTSAAWVKAGRRVVFWLVGGSIVLSALISISGAVVATGSVTVE